MLSDKQQLWMWCPYRIEFGSLWRMHLNILQYVLLLRKIFHLKSRIRDAQILALESEAIEARDNSRAKAELSKVLSKETKLKKELELLAT